MKRAINAACIAFSLLFLHSPVCAESRKADVLMKLGPPQQIMQVDGDEFWIYRWATPNEESRLYEGLRAWGLGVQGIPYNPQVQMDEHMLILRFGPDGELKEYQKRP